MSTKLHKRTDKAGCNTDLVATYSVMNVLPSFSNPGGGRADRARPKSHNCHGTEQGHMTSGGKVGNNNNKGVSGSKK